MKLTKRIRVKDGSKVQTEGIQNANSPSLKKPQYAAGQSQTALNSGLTFLVAMRSFKCAQASSIFSSSWDPSRAQVGFFHKHLQGISIH